MVEYIRRNEYDYKDSRQTHQPHIVDQGEACVCHLEAALGYRQAYISQHLMPLRKVGLLDSRREGRFVFNQLNNPKLLELIEIAASLARLREEEFLPATNHPLSFRRGTRRNLC